jgi:hypothetical protein
MNKESHQITPSVIGGLVPHKLPVRIMQITHKDVSVGQNERCFRATFNDCKQRIKAR